MQLPLDVAETLVTQRALRSLGSPPCGFREFYSTELAREQADVLAFVNKNRGGCDTLSYDLADLIDAVTVSARAAHAITCQAVLEAWWQLNNLAIPVGEANRSACCSRANSSDWRALYA